jgi:hypothetical protein
MDLRELKDQIGSLMSNVGVVVPRDVAERGNFPGDYEDFVVVRNADEGDGFRDRPGPEEAGEVDSLIRDVVYEVDEEGPARPTPREHPSGRRQGPAPTGGRGAPPAEPESAAEAAEEEDGGDEEDLPTLEEAEKQLISRALKQFDGNRRKTAKALGISERTLYRKLKDIDEDL